MTRALEEHQIEKMRKESERDIDNHPLMIQAKEKIQSLSLEIYKLREKGYTFKDYSRNRLAAQGETRKYEERLCTGGLGMGGETAEFLMDMIVLAGLTGKVQEHIKKGLFHGKKIDNNKIILELGDVLWYVNFIADCIGSSLEEVALKNEEKLNSRYPNGFNIEDARKVKNELEE